VQPAQVNANSNGQQLFYALKQAAGVFKPKHRSEPHVVATLIPNFGNGHIITNADKVKIK